MIYPFHVILREFSKSILSIMSSSMIGCKFLLPGNISSQMDFAHDHVDFELRLFETQYFRGKIRISKCLLPNVPDFSFRNVSFFFTILNHELSYLSCSQGCSKFLCFDRKCEATLANDALFEMHGSGSLAVSNKLCRAVDVEVRQVADTIFYGANVMFTFQVRPVSAISSLACHIGGRSTSMLLGPSNSSFCKFYVESQLDSSSAFGVSIGDQYLFHF